MPCPFMSILEFSTLWIHIPICYLATVGLKLSEPPSHHGKMGVPSLKVSGSPGKGHMKALDIITIPLSTGCLSKYVLASARG